MLRQMIKFPNMKVVDKSIDIDTAIEMQKEMFNEEL